MTIATVPAWVAEHGDAWATMDDAPQSLEPFLEMVRARPGRRSARRPVAAGVPEDGRRAIACRPSRAKKPKPEQPKPTKKQSLMTALPIADHWFERTHDRRFDHPAVGATRHPADALQHLARPWPRSRPGRRHRHGVHEPHRRDWPGSSARPSRRSPLTGTTITSAAITSSTMCVVHPAEAPLLLDPPISSLDTSRGVGRRRRRCARGCRLPDAGALLRHGPARRAWRWTRFIRSRWRGCGTSTRATRSISAIAASR